MIVGLDLPLSIGDQRIATRTQAMFERRVVEEVRTARADHVFSHTASRIHGLQDVTALLDGEIDQDEAVRRLITRTRRYAKRQRTWMRRVANIHLLEADRPPGDVADAVEQLL